MKGDQILSDIKKKEKVKDIKVIDKAENLRRHTKHAIHKTKENFQENNSSDPSTSATDDVNICIRHR